MKKHLSTIGMLTIFGAFVYFGASSAPSYAANTTEDEASVALYNHSLQDTVPGTDTSKQKWKGKHKMKKDTTWKKDSIPQ